MTTDTTLRPLNAARPTLIRWIGLAGLVALTMGMCVQTAAADGGDFPSMDCGTQVKKMAELPKEMVTSHSKRSSWEWLLFPIELTSSTVIEAASSVTATTVCLDKAGAYLMAQRRRQDVFARVNVLALSQGIAQGGNEEMNVLIGLMGCPQDVAPRLSALAQEHYAELVPSPAFDGAEVMGALRRVVRADAELMQRCAWV